MKKVSESEWKEAMGNLMVRRASGGSTSKPAYNIAGDYKRHLTSCKPGKSVLDVGCGHMAIKQYLPKGTQYTGIDPFPCVDGVIKMKMEECSFSDKSFETVVAFAVLDGVNDFDMTMHHIARVCSRNIVILTGVEIPIDKFHTFMISELEIDAALMKQGFKKSYREELGNRKILLLEYARN